MGYGFGTYIKRDKILIKENTIINIGDSYLVFSLKIPTEISEENNFNHDNALILQIYNGNKKYEPIIISKSNKILYTIGRSEINDIMIEDKMLSRVHCFIYFDNKNWIIKDGNQYGIQSTNGTWFFAYDDIEIDKEMVFKSNTYNFLCKIVNMT